MNIIDLQKTIRNSQVGEELGKIERWKNFRSDESRETWIQLLGDTAVVLTHQEFFTQLASLYLLQELFQGKITAEDFETLKYGFTIHDVGEATVGDIPHFEKTATSDSEEHQHALANIHSLGLSTEELNLLEQAYLKVVMGDQAVLQYMFKAFEKTEYLDTAIKAFRSLVRGAEFKKGWLLVARVLALDLPKILEYAQKLPYSVGQYLRENTETINEMFIQAEKAVNLDLAEKFQATRQLWQDYSSPVLAEETPAAV